MLKYLFSPRIPRPAKRRQRNTFHRYAVEFPVGMLRFIQQRLDVAARSVLDDEPVTELTPDELIRIDVVLATTGTVEDLAGQHVIVPANLMGPLCILVHEQIQTARVSRLPVCMPWTNAELIGRLQITSRSMLEPTRVLPSVLSFLSD